MLITLVLFSQRKLDKNRQKRHRSTLLAVVAGMLLIISVVTKIQAQDCSVILQQGIFDIHSTEQGLRVRSCSRAFRQVPRTDWFTIWHMTRSRCSLYGG